MIKAAAQKQLLLLALACITRVLWRVSAEFALSMALLDSIEGADCFVPSRSILITYLPYDVDNLQVGVRVEEEDMRTGGRTHCCSAYLTFVAVSARAAGMLPCFGRRSEHQQWQATPAS